MVSHLTRSWLQKTASCSFEIMLSYIVIQESLTFIKLWSLCALFGNPDEIIDRECHDVWAVSSNHIRIPQTVNRHSVCGRKTKLVRLCAEKHRRQKKECSAGRSNKITAIKMTTLVTNPCSISKSHLADKTFTCEIACNFVCGNFCILKILYQCKWLLQNSE